MTTFHLTIGTDNAAFDPEPEPELAHLLRSIADRIEYGSDHGNLAESRPIYDSNGNRVGQFTLTEEPVLNDIRRIARLLAERTDDDNAQDWAADLNLAAHTIGGSA
jgi:hypothetical protein